jgi:hypothetical protein
MRHPDEGRLLRYLDGELPGRKARQVRRHLDGCLQCRSELKELEATASVCGAYRKSLSACLPPAPAPWQDLSRGFDRIDARMEQGSLAARIARALTPPPVRWTAMGAAALALVFVLAYQWRETPSVQASALLRKAIQAADARPKRERRIRIRTRDGEVTRTAGRSDSSAPLVAARFRSARYDWDDPLSARSYQAWREGLANKRDEVATVEGRQAPDQGFYRIGATTSDGELVSASLTLRIPDLEPTQGRFEFRDAEWVEMTELPDLTEPPASKVAEATGGIPSKPAMPPPPQEGVAGPAGMGKELRAVEALHELGADLGDPLEVTNSGGRIQVTGSGISPERQRQIRGALDSLAQVDVRFTDAAPPARTEERENPAAAGAAAVPSVDNGLRDQLGGRVQFERFSAQLLDRSDAAMARAYALRRLAQEFSPQAEREMAAPDRRVLRSMAREHLAALAAGFAAIDEAVSPLLSKRGGSGPAQESRAAAGAWQDEAEQALRAAREVETALAGLLGTAPAEGGAGLPSRFASAMSNLKASLERCQRLLSYD